MTRLHFEWANNFYLRPKGDYIQSYSPAFQADQCFQQFHDHWFRNHVLPSSATFMSPGLGKHRDLIIEKLTEMGLQCLQYDFVDKGSVDKGILVKEGILFASETAIVHLSIRSIGQLVGCSFIHQEEHEKFMDWLQEVHQSHSQGVQLKILRKSREGLDYKPVQIKPRPFIKSNYADSVTSLLSSFRDNVLSPKVFGRLHILAGVPGTGKTSLIHSLLVHEDKATFLLLPSTYVSLLQGEDLLQALLSSKEEDKPLVLIVEDADEALEVRNGRNQGTVSALLNSVDGLLSETLDLRVLATTNLPLSKLDPALRREGRLGTLLTIPELSREEARVTLEHLSPGNTEVLKENKYTLAEIYGLLNVANKRIILETSPKTRVGF